MTFRIKLDFEPAPFQGASSGTPAALWLGEGRFTSKAEALSLALFHQGKTKIPAEGIFKDGTAFHSIGKIHQVFAFGTNAAMAFQARFSAKNIQRVIFDQSFSGYNGIMSDRMSIFALANDRFKCQK